MLLVTTVHTFIKKVFPKPSKVYDTYRKFAVERQHIFFNKLSNRVPWTEDAILAKHKFTNAYRASDRVSQFLIKNVIYAGSQEPKELLFRILLFKTFNKIETWKALSAVVGGISYKKYSFAAYDEILSELIDAGTSIYSGAYIMASGKRTFGYERKHQNHLQLINAMMHDNLADKIQKSPSMSALFLLLKGYPTIGNFLAYQYAMQF